MNRSKIALLFDVDGVIISTPHENSWRNSALKWELIPKNFDFKTFYQKYVAGIPGLKGAETILEKTNYYKTHSITSQKEKEKMAKELRELKQQFLDEYIDKGEFNLFEDIIQIVKGSKKDGIPVAAVSASENAERILKEAELYDLFDSVTLGAISHRINKKEHLYAFAFGKLCGNLRFDSPPYPIVFEDADKAIKSVRNLGYGCIGIARTNLTTPSSLIKKGADIAYDEVTLKEKGYLGVKQDLEKLALSFS